MQGSSQNSEFRIQKFRTPCPLSFALALKTLILDDIPSFFLLWKMKRKLTHKAKVAKR
jgi:hypothetical protein